MPRDNASGSRPVRMQLCVCLAIESRASKEMIDVKPCYFPTPQQVDEAHYKLSTQCSHAMPIIKCSKAVTWQGLWWYHTW